MADYNITLADGTTIVTIPEGAALTSYTIPLVGQNTTTYGDDVAQAFLHSLENFASATAPESNAALVGATPNTILPGQLWYDSGNGILNVNTSATATTTPNWSPIASTAQGATTDSTLRWDGTNWVEASQVRSSATGSLSIWESGGSPTDNVSFTHDGTDFIVDGNSLTQDFTIQNITGDLTVTGGRGLSVEDSGTAIAIRADSGSTAINVTAASTTDINLPSGATLNTAATGTARSGLNVPHGTAPSAPVDGDVWTTSAGIFARINGVTNQLDASAGGTVTATNGVNNRVATFTNATNIDGDANFTWDGTNLSATQIGGIVEANLLDKSQNSEVISGTNWDFSGISNSSGQIAATSGTTLRILSTDNTDWVDFSHGSGVNDGDFDIQATATNNIRIGGADVRLNDGSSLYLEEASGTDSKIYFKNTVETTGGGEIQWLDNLDNVEARVFYYSGFMDIACDSTIWLDSTGNNGRVAVATNAILYDGETGATVASLGTQRRDAGNDNTSSAYVYGADGTQRDIGYNITPSQGLAPASTYTLDKDDASKYINKDGILAASTVECPQDTNIPIGFTVIVANDGTTAGNISIDAGIGASIQWLDGSGAPPTGNRTLAIGGVCTLRKATNSGTHRWTIWGTGIT